MNKIFGNKTFYRKVKYNDPLLLLCYIFVVTAELLVMVLAVLGIIFPVIFLLPQLDAFKKEFIISIF
jgi:hypothetical protein